MKLTSTVVTVAASALAASSALVVAAANREQASENHGRAHSANLRGSVTMAISPESSSSHMQRDTNVGESGRSLFANHRWRELQNGQGEFAQTLFGSDERGGGRAGRGGRGSGRGGRGGGGRGRGQPNGGRGREYFAGARMGGGGGRGGKLAGGSSLFAPRTAGRGVAAQEQPTRQRGGGSRHY
ncbi:hypothetical protein ACA910_020845 [Epithemia clementina (nom. ined.)]